MANFELQANEAVVLPAVNAVTGSGFSSTSGELTLTNLHLIWVSKGVLGNIKRIQYLPLSQVKVIDDQAQVILSKTHGVVRLEVFFQQSHEAFQFTTGGKREILRWVDAISKLVAGDASQIRKAPTKAIPGTEAVAETLRDTFSQFKGAFSGGPSPVPEIVRVATKCTSCGAPIAGISGKIARCEYCDSACTLR